MSSFIPISVTLTFIKAKWGILWKKGANIGHMGQLPHIWGTALKKGQNGNPAFSRIDSTQLTGLSRVSAATLHNELASPWFRQCLSCFNFRLIGEAFKNKKRWKLGIRPNRGEGGLPGSQPLNSFLKNTQNAMKHIINS